MSVPLEPLRFRRHLVEKVWGGRALEARFGFELPAGKRIGETWEIVDREGENSVVDGGPFDGLRLADLMKERGSELLGSAPASRSGRFPLLVKYIDAADDLSVQVHPNEEAAAALGGAAESKTEAWVVVDVDAGGKLYAGLRPGLDRAQYEPVASRAEGVPLLVDHDVAPGDCVLVRGGTVHAIGKGVTILEVQENSDTTYRLYDWGRVGLDGQPRETHVEEAMACTVYDRVVERIRPSGLSDEPEPLVHSPLFGLDRLRLTEAREEPAAEAFRIYAVLSGSGAIVEEGRFWSLETGSVWLLPASFGAHRIAPAQDGLELIVARPGA